jgi:hypothetical protein|nr:uncharacterized protein LOC127334079 [Lolium perenne]XP_051216456.1 uncharacterized protein LOC127334080 [Lolium perenne]
MEELVAARRKLALSMESFKTTIDESQSFLRELVNSYTKGIRGATPAKLMLFGFGLDIGDVEVVAASLPPSLTSTTILVLAGVLITALKPEALTPTTCSTQVLASIVNAMSAKLNHCTVPALTSSGIQEVVNPWVQHKASFIPAHEVLGEIFVQTGTVVIVARSIGDSATRTRREPVQVQLHKGIKYNHVRDSP